MARKHYMPSFLEIDVLFGVANVLRTHLDGELSDDGLSANRLLALAYVAKHSNKGSQCIAERLGQHMGLAKTTAQNLVARMKKEGLLKETPMPGWQDLRRKQLRLTPKGAARLDSGLEIWEASVTGALKAIDSDRLRELGAALKAISGAATRIQATIDREGESADWTPLGQAQTSME